MKVLSLGAGVQSTTLLLMAHEGEIERPDVAIFADTQWEPAAVYEHLGWLETVSSIPIERVTAGNIRDEALSKAGRFASMPLHLTNGNGTKGQLRRQCTNEYKLRPIRRRIRELTSQAEMWIGISLDEAHRMRDSDVRYITNRYPLVERRMTRWDCMQWLTAHGYATPPKSACIGCPFHGDRNWRALKERPDEWADAVAFDHAVRELPRIKGRVYLHASLKPLDEVDLSTPKDHGQQDMFSEECTGLCGV